MLYKSDYKDVVFANIKTGWILIMPLRLGLYPAFYKPYGLQLLILNVKALFNIFH